MKPLNYDDPGCNYTTSNCVIWQGPNLPCINLCKGDTVSTVIYNLAVELCDMLDMLKVDAYDISCFNLTSCKPEDFQELIQLLIKRICCLETCTGCKPDCNGNCLPPDSPALPGGGSGCPDCIVNIAPCFYYTNQFGDQVTSMQLTDYVNAIGNKLCDTIKLINTQQEAIVDVGVRVAQLENAPPPEYTPPTVTPACVLPSVPTEMNIVLAALETQFCQLVTATGSPNDIYTNIAKQCAGLNSQPSLGGTGVPMSSLPGWSASVNTLAQAFGNMWVAMCDTQQAVRNIQLNCCPSGCDGVTLSLNALLAEDTLTIYVNGTIPDGFQQCSASGTLLQITDSAGGYASFYVDIVAYLNNPTGYAISLTGTPINIALDLSLEMKTCLENSSTNATCESCLNFLVVNSALCPTIDFITTENSIAYSFTSGVGNYTYSVQLWDAAGGIMISSQTTVTAGVESVSGEFVGLDPEATYKIRVVITATGCAECEPTVCPFAVVITNPTECIAPEDVTAEIEIP